MVRARGNGARDSLGKSAILSVLKVLAGRSSRVVKIPAAAAFGVKFAFLAGGLPGWRRRATSAPKMLQSYSLLIVIGSWA